MKTLLLGPLPLLTLLVQGSSLAIIGPGACTDSRLSIEDPRLEYFSHNQSIAFHGTLVSDMTALSSVPVVATNLTATQRSRFLFNNQTIAAALCSSSDSGGHCPVHHIMKLPTTYSPSHGGISLALDFLDKDSRKVVGCVLAASSPENNSRELVALRWVTIGLALFSLIVTVVCALFVPRMAESFYRFPNFLTLFYALQGVAFSGMYSIPYPTVYRRFSQSFAWSVGIIAWSGLESDLDGFRDHREGDLTESSVASSSSSSVPFVGIRKYVQLANVPYANAFTTALIWWALAFAAILAGAIVTLTVVTIIRKTTNHRFNPIVALGAVLFPFFVLLYPACVLWTMYQFTIGDSWATLLLAGILIGLFTLAIFLGLVHTVAVKLGQTGDPLPGYTGVLHYRSFWFMLIPPLYLFAKGAFIGLGHGSAMVQIVGSLAIETILLIMVAVFRPLWSKFFGGYFVFGQVIQIVCLVLFLMFTSEVAKTNSRSTKYAIALVVLQSIWCVVSFVALLAGVILAFFVARRPVSQTFAGESLDLPTRVREIPMMPSSPASMGPLTFGFGGRGNEGVARMRNVSKSYGNVHEARSEESIEAPVVEDDTDAAQTPPNNTNHTRNFND